MRATTEKSEAIANSEILRRDVVAAAGTMQARSVDAAPRRVPRDPPHVQLGSAGLIPLPGERARHGSAHDPKGRLEAAIVIDAGGAPIGDRPCEDGAVKVGIALEREIRIGRVHDGRGAAVAAHAERGGAAVPICRLAAWKSKAESTTQSPRSNGFAISVGSVRPDVTPVGFLPATFRTTDSPVSVTLLDQIVRLPLPPKLLMLTFCGAGESSPGR